MMKKILSLALAGALAFSLVACGTSTASSGSGTSSAGSEEAEADSSTTTANGGGDTIYVIGPSPDHGWTAQAGTYGQQKAEEIDAEGTFKGVYYSAGTSEDEVDLCNTIVANGDAAGVLIHSFDEGTLTGLQALADAGIPFVQFDRDVTDAEDLALFTYTGDNLMCGAGIAYFMQQNGLEPGDVVVRLDGDTGIVCGDRTEGFAEFLQGKVDYYDDELDQTFHTSQEWTDEEIAALYDNGSYVYVCDWSADTAYSMLQPTLDAIVADAVDSGTGKLFFFSHDDEMTFGLMNLLEGSDVSDATKASLEELDVSVSAIGGMQEIYDVMLGSDAQSEIANTYFDSLMSIYFSPSNIQIAIDLMLEVLTNGTADYNGTELTTSNHAVIAWSVHMVDATNAATQQGFTGH